jgi:putative ABC transport system permease protein
MVLRNRLRSALAMVGIVIAVVAVVGTVAVGQGAQARVAQDLASLGQSLMFVSAVSGQQGGTRMGAGTGTAVTLADVDAIARELPHVIEHVAPMVRSAGQVVAGHANWATTLVGTTPGFFAARGWMLAAGSPFDDEDVAQARKRCVLGANVHKQLFGSEDGVGRVVRVRGMMCQITGVLEPKGATGFGPDQDDMLFMPITTLTRRLLPLKHSRGVTAMIKAASPKLGPTAEEEVAKLLRQRHRIGPGQVDDFSIFNLSELQKSAERQARTLSLLLSGVALISLMVGAIGIANVMLVAVTERTGEIGLRMALGARAKDILLQFLLEALTLSLLGALLGLAIGSAGAWALSTWTPWPAALSGHAALWAVVAAVVAGVSAGLYPARRASLLDPITALRYD